jgi:hypothetical protein
MFFDPRALFMLVVLVGVTGYVVKNVLLAMYRLNKGDQPKGDRVVDLEERLRKIEAATSSLLVEMSSMKEKQRFMTRLQAGAAPSAPLAAVERRNEGELDPMSTQSVPAIPRVGSPRA